jgi:hypothetical protein
MPAAGCAQEDSGPLAGNSWVYGVLLAVLAALANNLGVNMQKLAWTKKQLNQASGPVYRTIWLVGLLGVILASVFDFVALFFAPQSVIAPLGALTMVSNACVAPWMHGEIMHRITLVATMVIVAGCVLSVAMATHSNVICAPQALFDLYVAPLFLGYAAVLFLLMTGIWLFVRKAEAAHAAFGPEDPRYRRFFKIHRVSYAGLAGLFGAQSVMFARSFNQLIVSTTDGGPVLFVYGAAWGIIIGLVGSIVLQLYWLNHGLARFESTYNVPIFTTAFIVDVVLGGGFLYGEFSSFTALQAGLFPLGIFLCIAGVIVLTNGTAADELKLSAVEDEILQRISPSHTPNGSARSFFHDNPATGTSSYATDDKTPVNVAPRNTGGFAIRASTRLSIVVDNLIDELSPKCVLAACVSPRLALTPSPSTQDVLCARAVPEPHELGLAAGVLLHAAPHVAGHGRRQRAPPHAPVLDAAARPGPLPHARRRAQAAAAAVAHRLLQRRAPHRGHGRGGRPAGKSPAPGLHRRRGLAPAAAHAWPRRHLHPGIGHQGGRCRRGGVGLSEVVVAAALAAKELMGACGCLYM